MIPRAGLAFLFALYCALAAAQAQTAPSTYKPKVGQKGKDVVWVPSPDDLVEKMLDMAEVTSRDFVMDLGSGDGRTVIAAAKRGAKALGIEYNPDMVQLARENAKKAGVGNAEFRKADLFETDLSQATVITMFLLPEINLKLRPRILDLKPGTRVVSNTFDMGDWKPDEVSDPIPGCEGSWCTALLWIVPAKVGGRWKTPQGDVTLRQEYQMLTGRLRADGKAYALNGKVVGEEARFAAGGREYRGRLVDGRLELK
ncbi:MAG TPA: class I SAM-dependent methyltransferase [Burkholderiales bacterium]|nr:class I SAM-dependent methyltransferase [Burkholderiales bacterium]